MEKLRAKDRAEIDSDVPLQSVLSTPKRTGYLFAKRVFDISFSLLALATLSPFLLLISLLIWLDDPMSSPVYISERCGKDGVTFTFFKFRSMVFNADKQIDQLAKHNEADGPVFKIKDDPRITRIGRFLRKTSLDELPQLLNVLLGDMSIVGPRPPLPSEVARYTPLQWERLSIKPGLTCYWQVDPRRYVMSFDQWLSLDLRYIQNRNFRLDLQLILKTIVVMFSCSGE